MRALLPISALIVCLTSAASLAEPQKCPVDAAQASNEVWAPRTIKTGQTVAGRHPCGRRLTCIGSIPGVPRNCRWL
jgi:hypothetical protein